MLDPLEHKGLIIKILNSYRSYADSYSNVDYQDLMQEGWVAVLRKIENHDPERGAVSTLLHPWIRDAMSRYIKHRSVYRRSIRSGLKLSDYMFHSSEFDDTKGTIYFHSPELEFEARQEVFIKMNYYYHKNKYRKVKNSRFIEIEELLTET